MVNSTQSSKQTLTLLYDQVSPGAEVSGSRQNLGEEAASGIKLLKNEWAEIKYIEVDSPTVAATGAAEALEQIIPVIDGKKFQGGTSLILRADLDSLQLVARESFAREMEAGNHETRMLFNMGLTLPELVAKGVASNPTWLLRNTTIKVGEAGKINFEYLVGNSPLVDTFRIKCYGVKYTSKQILEFYIAKAYGGARRIPLIDPKSGRDFSFNITASSLQALDFTKLIGGNDVQLQGGVEIKTLDRWARNDVATTANTDYVMSFDDNNVRDRDQNMDFDLDDETLILITNVGIKKDAAGSLLDVKISVNDEEMFFERTRPGNNLDFGRVSAIGAGIDPKDHLFKSVPAIDPVFMSNETGRVIIKDNGTAILDGTNFNAGVMVVIQGFTIKNPAFKQNTQNIIGLTPGVDQSL